MIRNKLLYHKACTVCPSSDGLAVYRQDDGRITGYCFSCQTYVRDPEGTQHTLEDNNKMIHEKIDLNKVSSLPMAAIPSRNITEETAKAYGVRTEYSTTNKEPVAYYFPASKDGKIVGYKKRMANTKEFHGLGTLNRVDFFGQLGFGGTGKMVVLTEGEIDALSAHQMFQSVGKNYRVWSLPNGANVSSIKDNLELLEKFETVILALDQDEPGQKCAKAICELLTPGKAKVMSFSEKDANDMLKTGKVQEFIRSLYNAKEFRPDGIVSVEEMFEEAIKPIDWGLSWPWPSLTKTTFGIRRKELYGFGGGTGAGKTEGFKEVIQHILHEHNKKVGLFFLEENPAMTLKVIAGKIDNRMYHIPDGGWNPEDLKKSIQKLSGQVYLYNHFGQKSWDNIKSKIRYMVVALGIKDIFLDHLTALVAEEEDVNRSLEGIMADMAALTQELDFTLYYISHLTTPTGTPHEEGGRVTASQFRGSRTIAYWSNFLFGYERNQQAEDITERNTVILRVLKDRYTGMSTGTTIRLKYNRDTGRFLEIPVEF